MIRWARKWWLATLVVVAVVVGLPMGVDAARGTVHSSSVHATSVTPRP